MLNATINKADNTVNGLDAITVQITKSLFSP